MQPKRRWIRSVIEGATWDIPLAWTLRRQARAAGSLPEL